MGADLSMMSRDFRPRPDKVYWDLEGDEQVLVIERDTFPGGYQVLYRGKIDGAEAVLKAFGIKVPPKPPKPTYEYGNFMGTNDEWDRPHIILLVEDGQPFGKFLKNRLGLTFDPLIRLVRKSDFKN